MPGHMLAKGIPQNGHSGWTAKKIKTGHRKQAALQFAFPVKRKARNLGIGTEIGRISCTSYGSTYKITDIYHKVNGREVYSWKWSGLSERK